MALGQTGTFSIETYTGDNAIIDSVSIVDGYFIVNAFSSHFISIGRYAMELHLRRPSATI